MVQYLIGCVVLVLISAAGNAQAADPKKDITGTGSITKVDREKGIITIKLMPTKEDNNPTEIDYLLPGDLNVTILASDEFKKINSGEGLKNGTIQKGLICTFTADPTRKIKRLSLAEPAKKN